MYWHNTKAIINALLDDLANFSCLATTHLCSLAMCTVHCTMHWPVYLVSALQALHTWYYNLALVATHIHISRHTSSSHVIYMHKYTAYKHRHTYNMHTRMHACAVTNTHTYTHTHTHTHTNTYTHKHTHTIVLKVHTIMINMCTYC